MRRFWQLAHHLTAHPLIGVSWGRSWAWRYHDWTFHRAWPGTATAELHVYEVDDGEEHTFAALGLMDALNLYEANYGSPDDEDLESISVERWSDDRILEIGHEHDDDVPETFRARADDGTVSATCREWVQACGRGLLGSTLR